MANLTLTEYRWSEDDDEYRRGHYRYGTTWVDWTNRGGDPASDDWEHFDARVENHIFHFIPRVRSLRKNGSMEMKIRHSGGGRLKRVRYRLRETTEWRLSGSFSETMRRELEYYAKQESKFRFDNTYMDTPYLEPVTLIICTSSPGCITSDLGKTVRDDGTNLGPLLYYDNALFRMWVAYDNDPVVATGSSIDIVSGTGAGTSNGTSRNYSDYHPSIPSAFVTAVPSSEVVFVIIKSYNFSGSEGRLIFGDREEGGAKTDSEREVQYEIVLERVSARQVEGYGGYP